MRLDEIINNIDGVNGNGIPNYQSGRKVNNLPSGHKFDELLKSIQKQSSDEIAAKELADKEFIKKQINIITQIQELIKHGTSLERAIDKTSEERSKREVEDAARCVENIKNPSYEKLIAIANLVAEYYAKRNNKEYLKYQNAQLAILTKSAEEHTDIVGPIENSSATSSNYNDARKYYR
jgi:hypothetical protein